MPNRTLQNGQTSSRLQMDANSTSNSIGQVGCTDDTVESGANDIHKRSVSNGTAAMMRHEENSYDTPLSETKILNDPVHGHIELHKLCVAIIDTPQFQRLRYIKQMGVCFLVYPGANVTRFEHSVGTCHLAGLLVDAVMQRQPYLRITNEDKLCVLIAALCHDLGHGPYSHLFDSAFMKSVRPERKWTHEEASIRMLDWLIEANDLIVEFNNHNLYGKDITFIKELINGPLNDGQYVGRDQHKSFLYEIVSNKETGIDVDKMDYFARDCHHLGMTNSFDHIRFFKFIHVGSQSKDNKRHICVRDKEASNVYELFSVRCRLHRKAYQHPVIQALEMMFTDALIKANDYIAITGSNSGKYRMSECCEDMAAFAALRDTVYHRILDSDDMRLREARTILERVESRRLYRMVAYTQPLQRQHIPSDLGTMSEELVQIAAATRQSRAETCAPDTADTEPTLGIDDIGIRVQRINYGMDDKNPIDNVLFYNKSNPDLGFHLPKEDVSVMLPSNFHENSIRVICKSLDHTIQTQLVDAFVLWCSRRGLAKPKLVS